MEIITDENKIAEILTRGVEEVFVKDELEKKLKSGQKLRIKFGIDPTSPNIHLGRAVVLRKVKAFQDLGHTIVLIIGDQTALIGDPSDKLEKRPSLTREQVLKNLETYKEQIGKILDLDRVEFRYNSEWLTKMGFLEIAQLLDCFTVQQMSKRRNFHDRLQSGQDVFVNEFMYPALQGYDSVVVDSDVELGGFDQLFNLMAGRTVQKKYGKPEQDVMTIAMLEGTDGRKMSSSWGNIVALLDTPNDMYGKIMSVRDDLVGKYFMLCTDIPQEEILEMDFKMQNGENPMQFKKRLAREIVTIYHSADDAAKAEANWENTFSKGGLPDDIPEVAAEPGTLLVDILVKQGIVESKSDFRRLVDEGAIKIVTQESEIKIEDQKVEVSSTATFKIGKRKFLKVIIKK